MHKNAQLCFECTGRFRPATALIHGITTCTTLSERPGNDPLCESGDCRASQAPQICIRTGACPAALVGHCNGIPFGLIHEARCFSRTLLHTTGPIWSWAMFMHALPLPSGKGPMLHWFFWHPHVTPCNGKLSTTGQDWSWAMHMHTLPLLS